MNIIEALNDFVEEFEFEFHSNPKFLGGAIGLPSNETKEGIVLYFETKKALESFPFQEKTYKGYPVNKIVIGKIKPL
jgi:hypothetical protein